MTHSVNKGQRYVGLDFTQTSSSTLRITGPDSPNHATPGYYMLFILNGDDVPSVARMVQLLPSGEIFVDAFESGDTSNWSSSLP